MQLQKMCWRMSWSQRNHVVSHLMFSDIYKAGESKHSGIEEKRDAKIHFVKCIILIM